MGGGRSNPPPVEVNQCEQLDTQLKTDLGSDYRTNRTVFPITSEALSFLSSTPCETYFGYAALRTEFCSNVYNFPAQIGHGQTCADHTDVSMRSQWCLKDETGAAVGTRLKTDGKCSKTLLGTQYDTTATTFCKQNPKDKWCACYNFKNKVCDTTPSAAGCVYYKGLEDNRKVFGPEPETEIPAAAGRPARTEFGYSPGYLILKDKAHCRPRACDMGYVPDNVMSDCEPSYRICDKDINIQSSSNSIIAVECNGDMKDTVFPDWWDEEFDDSFFDDEREPPFDRFPLNMLPITSFPKKFIWKNKNVRYLTYGGTGSVSFVSCCCCIILMMISSLKKR